MNENVMNIMADRIAALRNTRRFDEDWYCERYPDVRILGMDPIEHYLWIGAEMGRDPSPTFSTREYLRLNLDIARAGANPFLHYVLTGANEGRRTGLPQGVGTWFPPKSRYVARESLEAPRETSARVIAFYLPQFHAIPQNDRWWGKGFTEWTNVRPARPLFKGHYQPHVPHPDIGYYDLTDQKIQSFQMELAKNYGIEGFCYYYYSFGGQRLLETPLENHLKNPSLDLPFCVCWANENWTRRWDGLDKEVLIAQNYSPENDLEIISDLATYIRDPRYIRVDGKPLIVVYRPSLLPDAHETSKRWRNWCRQNGIGEIHLALTQSFDKNEPSFYGFDAAIEFPPILSVPPTVTSAVDLFIDDYSGQVHDWDCFLDRSHAFVDPGYPLYRSVCPGWDNTARRKSAATVFVNNTPEKYRRWLENAVADSTRRFPQRDDRLIFVNAWNEWAEGAHLEPDEALGYAYLEATRAALLPPPRKLKVAIAVHVFYLDILDEILRYFERLPSDICLFVTTLESISDDVRRKLAACRQPFTILVCENRGRDVLPFLHMLQRISDEGFDIVAKVHTKRSPHREDGDQWRNQLYDGILNREVFMGAIDRFRLEPAIGMIGPEGHLVPMDVHLGSNVDRVLTMAGELGLAPTSIMKLGFFAGTMFIARVDALAPVLNLVADYDEFEEEAGQLDGTLAHALERIFCACAIAQGYRSEYSTGTGANISSEYGFV